MKKGGIDERSAAEPHSKETRTQISHHRGTEKTGGSGSRRGSSAAVLSCVVLLSPPVHLDRHHEPATSCLQFPYFELNNDGAVEFATASRTAKLTERVHVANRFAFCTCAFLVVTQLSSSIGDDGKRGAASDAPSSDVKAMRLADAARLMVEAGRLFEAGNFVGAIEKTEAATAIRKELLGDEHLLYATSLGNLALLYMNMGEHARAEPLLIESSEIYERAGEGHPGYAPSLTNLALLYERMGKYERSEPLYLKALTAFKKAGAEKHRHYVPTVCALAGLYAKLDDFARAEPMYIEAGEILKRASREKTADNVSVLSGLANLYLGRGDYAKAHPLLVKATAISKEVLGKDHPDYAIGLNSLAWLHLRMGDPTGAEPLFIEACEITRSTLGAKHPEYAQKLSGLAAAYHQMKDYARAESLHVEAGTIIREVYGAKHDVYADHLINLALVYERRGDYQRAERAFVEAVAIFKEAKGPNHRDYGMGLSNLASLYSKMNEHGRAEPLLVEAATIRKEALGEMHPNYADSLNQLAILYAATGRAAEAESHFRAALRILRTSLDATAIVQSERQQSAMMRAFRYPLNGYVSLALNTGRDASEVFREVLRWKGSILVRQRGMRAAGEDPAVKELFMRLQRIASQSASLSRTVPEKEEERVAWRKKLLESVRQQERLQAELSAKSAPFREATRDVTLEDVRAALPQDAVLVDYLEFIRSTPAENGRIVWERQLAAFVVRSAGRSESGVSAISLGPVAPVNAAIDTWRRTLGAEAAAATAASTLRKAVWDPVQMHIGDAKTVLVSTDGALGRLPLGALPGSIPGKFLIEEHRLAMLPVPQVLPTLLDDGKRRVAARELLLLGGVDYDAVPSTDGASIPKKKQPRRPGDRASSPADGRLFDPLPGTDGEVTYIRELYRRQFEVTADDPKSLLQAEADEARFRRFAPHYRHLHLATHGFFAGEEYSSTLGNRNSPDGRERALLVSPEADVRGYSPWLLSGLALAGANREPTAAGDDGILTSQEIGTMDLSGVDMVVLSACDTGLGETAGGEGLLGVQRAFQIAGARTTIASFWKVDDLVTRHLMEHFYRNLWEKEMPRLDALREAQLHVLNHPEEVRGLGAVKPLPSEASGPDPKAPRARTDVRYWGAFTLSGEWR